MSNLCLHGTQAWDYSELYLMFATFGPFSVSTATQQQAKDLNDQFIWSEWMPLDSEL